jgi:hypothetical protein
MTSYYLHKYHLFRAKCKYDYTPCVLIFLFNTMQEQCAWEFDVCEGGRGRQQSGKEVTPGCFKKHGRNFLIIATSINACWGEDSGGLLLAMDRREESCEYLC